MTVRLNIILVINQSINQLINQSNIPLRVSSTVCSKHVEAYNKLIIKQKLVH